MLQKIVNGIAIASGVVSLTVVGTAAYVFVQKDAIIEGVKSKVMESVLPGGLGGAVGGGALGGAIQLPTSPTSPDAPTQAAPDAGLSLPSPF